MNATEQEASIFEMAVRRREAIKDRLGKGEWNDPIYSALPKMAQVKDGQLSMGMVNDQPIPVDTGKQVARFLISSMRKDRDGDIMVPQGCKKTLADYERNPVVFFGHRSGGLPIARTIGLEVRDDFGIYAEAKFHCETKESEDVFRLVECGELRCASIGFFPTLGELLEPTDDSGLAKNQMLFQNWYCFKFTEWNLVEWSVVGIPSNPDCLAVRLAKGFGGKPVSEPVRRILQPYAAAPKVWANGFVPDEVDDAPSVVKEAPKSVAAPENVLVIEERVTPSVITAEQVQSMIAEAFAKHLASVAVPDPPIPAPVPAPSASPNDVDLATVKALEDIRKTLDLNAKKLRRMTGSVD